MWLWEEGEGELSERVRVREPCDSASWRAVGLEGESRCTHSQAPTSAGEDAGRGRSSAANQGRER